MVKLRHKLYKLKNLSPSRAKLSRAYIKLVCFYVLKSCVIPCVILAQPGPHDDQPLGQHHHPSVQKGTPSSDLIETLIDTSQVSEADVSDLPSVLDTSSVHTSLTKFAWALGEVIEYTRRLDQTLQKVLREEQKRREHLHRELRQLDQALKTWSPTLNTQDIIPYDQMLTQLSLRVEYVRYLQYVQSRDETSKRRDPPSFEHFYQQIYTRFKTQVYLHVRKAMNEDPQREPLLALKYAILKSLSPTVLYHSEYDSVLDIFFADRLQYRSITRLLLLIALDLNLLERDADLVIIYQDTHELPGKLSADYALTGAEMSNDQMQLISFGKLKTYQETSIRVLDARQALVYQIFDRFSHNPLLYEHMNALAQRDHDRDHESLRPLAHAPTKSVFGAQSMSSALIRSPSHLIQTDDPYVFSSGSVPKRRDEAFIERPLKLPKKRVILKINTQERCDNRSIRRLFLRRFNKQVQPSSAQALGYIFYSRSQLCLNRDCDLDQASPLLFQYTVTRSKARFIKTLCREGKKLRVNIDPWLCEQERPEREYGSLSYLVDYRACAQQICTDFFRYQEDLESWCQLQAGHICAVYCP